MKKIISLVGARPNFIKIAPLHKVFKTFSKEVTHKICHTGQHFDENMSKIFFDELDLPKPDFYLGIGGGTHTEQTAGIMIEFEKVLLQEKPDLIIVPGDVNSTLAGALTASKMGIKIAHVESGLRSFDRSMPEEINRMVTDILADYLFVSEKSGLDNLNREGIDNKKIFFVGNIMIDSLVHYLPAINASLITKDLELSLKNYVLVTFHRPNNVDNLKSLKDIVNLLNNISVEKKVLFPVHPRTKGNLEKFGLLKQFAKNVLLTDPLGYVDFLALAKNAELIITDSGGIQEETTFMGIQCITVRNNTERPVTVDIGTNHLAGTDLDLVKDTTFKILKGAKKKGSIPELWDGKTANRVANIILEKQD
jgi:UDP-N-acetylglucosamine 2-epimerase (non-hydrolysing)